MKLPIWKVPVAGFRWHRDDRRGLVLVPVDPVGPETPYEVKGGLFRDFATIDPTHDAVLAFANRYGQLYEGNELLDVWSDQVRDMRRVVVLANAIRLRDRETLGRHIVWKGKASAYYRDQDGETLIVDPKSDPAWWSSVKRPGHDSVTPAWCLIEQTINARLQLNAYPQLYFDHERGKPTFGYVANSLASALWIQAAQSLAADKLQDFCRYQPCGKWFDVTSGHAKAYCCDSHRQLAYLDRRRSAFKLWTGGKTVAEIAEDMGVKEKQVSTWIKTEKLARKKQR